MKNTVLILGSSGRFGRNCSNTFYSANWDVRHFDRSTDSLWDAAWGADVIVNCWNPAYPDWARDVPKLTERLIEVASASDATVILPGNIYGYGADAPATLTADTPQVATNPLGKIRIAMENAYKEAGIRTIVIRAGDFIDTEQSGNWFDRVLTQSIRKGKLTYPGPLDKPHAWAWLPDLAEITVSLAEKRDQLARFEDVPFDGFTLTGAELATAIEETLNMPVKAQQMAWWPISLLRPVWPMARALTEMRYLWSMDHKIDGAKLRRLLPHFHPTSLHDALEVALKDQINPDKPVTTRRIAVRS